MNARAPIAAVLTLPLVAVLGVLVLAAASSAPEAAEGMFYTCRTEAEGSVALVEATELSDEQIQNAVTIYTVGAERGLPEQAMVIALSTAMQESTLRNLGHLGEANDHDSIGLFQQRPSSGWGTPEQIQDPVYASTKFYDKLETIEGWQTMPVTQAAQAVQISAFPDAYAKWVPLADIAVDILKTIVSCQGVDLPEGAWTNPLPEAPVVSGFRSDGRPGHDGIDLWADKGAPIYAAGDGAVNRVRCNATLNGADYSCDTDGSPSVMGCGWYMQIAHPDGTLTRYCHMVSEPLFEVGDTVEAGDIIGYVGSSGNSSGPHLHLEAHTTHDASSSDATDPIRYFGARGISFPT
jgi:murein DD-endopeptidase MepM/ murein hydrolase activator NlpD